MPQPQPSQEEILKDLLDSAKQAVDKANYEALIEALIKLGEFNRAADLRVKKVKFKSNLAIHAFLQAWFDDGLRKSLPFDEDEKSERHLTAKAGMNASVRSKITKGLKVLGQHSQNIDFSKFKDVAETDIEQLDKAAVAAIQNYKTARQSVLQKIANTMAGLMAFSCGVSSGISIGVFLFAQIAALAVTGPVYFALAGLAIAVAGLGFVAGAYCNWKIFSGPAYNSLNNLFGKDRIFEGIYKFVNADGIKKDLRSGRKGIIRLVLKGLSVPLSLAAGIAAAMLPYSMVMALAATLAFIPAIVFPVVGIALAVAACIVTTKLFFESFDSILNTEKLSEIITKPFANIRDLFVGEDGVSVKKVATYAVTGLLLAIGLIGNVLFSQMSANMLTDFMVKEFGTIASVASQVGLWVAGIAAGIAQVPFIFESTAKTVINLYRLVVSDMQTVAENGKAKEMSAWEKVKHYGLGLLNAVSNAMITVVGMRASAPMVAATSASTFVVSATSVFGSETDDLTQEDRKTVTDAVSHRLSLFDKSKFVGQVNKLEINDKGAKHYAETMGLFSGDARQPVDVQEFSSDKGPTYSF